MGPGLYDVIAILITLLAWGRGVKRDQYLRGGQKCQTFV